MNNPNDHLKAKEEHFGTQAPRSRPLDHANDPSKATIVSAEMESKNQLGQLSKLTQNKKGSFLGEKIFSGETLISPSAGQRILPSLIQVIIVLIVLAIITFVLTMLSWTELPDWWAAFGLQAFWSYWLFVLNRAFARRYQCSAPLSLKELVLVCALNYAFMPVFTDYNGTRLLDPFFYLWLATLAYVPYKLGNYVDRQEKNEKGTSTQLGIWSTALCAFAALMSLFLPYDRNKGFIFGLFWLLSQTFWITYFALLLSGKLNANKMQSQSAAKKVYDGTNVVIRYSAYPELERWIRQSFATQRLNKGTRIILMWLVGPALVILGVTYLSGWLPTLYPTTIVQGTDAANIAAAAANIRFIYQFITGLVLLMVAAIGAFIMKPTHLGLGEKGMRFLWRRKFCNINSDYIPWSGLTGIYIEQKSNQASANAARLCFRDNQNRIKKIRLNALDSYEDKQLLLNAIRTWAPTISRDARVIESLQPPSDYSYTELWLQALSAPPKRERFKPLIKDALLKDERYKVLSSLGAGGQGFAYLVEDRFNEQEVVLKEFILPVYVDISIRKSALKQFENEARILSQLHHPQIVRLLDFFVEDHRAYLVLEHIDGASIRTVVESNGPISEENTRTLAKQMCDILGYLHSQIPPVVHRDFTPDNLILNTNGTLKLIDFNVAQSTESTTTGTVVGKPAYLPPEQFRGVPTTQSDIYAMGATLYFLLTGCDPLPITMSHPAQNNSKISAPLDSIVARATNLDLAKRYPDIAALKDNLTNIV